MKTNFQRASFYHSCYDAGLLFKGCDRRVSQVPHVMILGKSNVGKSSLFNSLTTSSLAKVSASPGKTKGLFFYMINDEFLFVDMPGIGFAKVDENTKDTWSKLLYTYLKATIQKFVLYLHDARRDWDEEEVQMLAWFASKQIPIGIVMTKCDKLSQSEMNQLQTKKNLPSFPFATTIFFYSTEEAKLKEEFKKNFLSWIKT